MRLPNMSRRSVRATIAAAAVILAGLGVTLAVGGGSTSANYAAKAPVMAHIDAGNLSLTATGSVNVTKLVPGKPQASDLTFKNTGNVRGDSLSIGNPVSVGSWTVPSGQTPDWSQVVVSIPGYLAETPVTAVGSDINLGSIEAGGTKTITVVVTLKSAGNSDAGDAKDNQFQNVAVNATVTAKVRTS